MTSWMSHCRLSLHCRAVSDRDEGPAQMSDTDAGLDSAQLASAKQCASVCSAAIVSWGSWRCQAHGRCARFLSRAAWDVSWLLTSCCTFDTAFRRGLAVSWLASFCLLGIRLSGWRWTRFGFFHSCLLSWDQDWCGQGRARFVTGSDQVS